MKASIDSLITLENNFLRVTVCPLGATVLEITVKNTKQGDIDVALGQTSSQDILNSTNYLGSTIGRCANRIAHGKFTLNGNEYTLATNNGQNHLHGGNKGFDKQIFDVVEVCNTSVTFEYNSCDCEEGYCGNLNFNVTYSIEGGALQIDYLAQCDADTVFNPTNHTYFNLNGHSDGSILDNVLQINANFFTPVDDTLIPTGDIAEVDEIFDFREPKAIGRDINKNHPQLQIAGGYDHNYCINVDSSKNLNFAACAHSPKTGIKMNVYTSLDGIQFYSGNFLCKVDGKALYSKYAGFCLETQTFPNAINTANFNPKPILRKGEQYHSTTKYVFALFLSF